VFATNFGKDTIMDVLPKGGTHVPRGIQFSSSTQVTTEPPPDIGEASPISPKRPAREVGADTDG